MEFSPDSSQLAVSIGDKTDFIDPQLGRVTGQFNLSPFSIAYSQDGSRLYLVSEYRSVLLDTLTAAEVKAQTQQTPGYIGVDLELQSGKLLIRSVTPGGPAEKAGVKQGAELIGITQGRNGRLRKMTGVEIRDAIKELSGSAGTFVQLKLLYPGSVHDDDAKTITIRRLAMENVAGKVRFKEMNIQAPKENLAWCMNEGKHEFREASSGKVVAKLDAVDIDNIGQYGISPDQTKFAIVARAQRGDSKVGVEVFDVATQERIAFVPLPSESYYDLTFAFDNNRVLVATYEGIFVIDIRKKKITAKLTLGWTAPPEEDSEDDSDSIPITAVAIASIRDELGFNKADRSRPPRQLVAKVTVSPQGVVAACDPFGRLTFWCLDSEELLYELPKKLEDCVETMLFSYDGRWFAYLDEGVLHLMDVSAAGRKSIESSKRALNRTPAKQSVTKVVSPASSTSSDPSLVPGLENSVSPKKSSTTVKWKVGDEVEVASRGRWFPSKIIREDATDRWLIHYEQSPDEWNEVAHGSRIRARQQ
jgi:DNA-binding beta-propeller fold protein YncE